MHTANQAEDISCDIEQAPESTDWHSRVFPTRARASSPRRDDDAIPSSWRHLRADCDDTVTDLSAEGWVYESQERTSDVPPESTSGPRSSRQPLSSWRPRQQYPSFAPPAATGSAFALKVLDTTSELIQSYRLRYDVYGEVGYLRLENRANLEIDPYDAYSIPFGAICLETRELVATLRLITDRVQPFYKKRIRKILDFVADPALTRQVNQERERRLPSLTSFQVENMLDVYNPEHRKLNEISRYIIDPAQRGSCLSRGLLEIAIAYAKTWGDPILIASCNPKHVPMNARLGFDRLPGVDDAVSDIVGRHSSTIVCDTRRLPEPSASRVTSIVQAMRSGEPECLIDGSERSIGAKGKYHFGDQVISTRPTHAELRFDASEESAG